ncbi:MAG TPA: hypothetical protein VM123_10305 [archaeon]|nr:hypothetical protein [archaeon]
MSDVMRVFFTGVEEFAKTMKEQASLSMGKNFCNQELIDKITALTEKVEQLVNLLEGKLGTTVAITPVKGKRMMDIKKRIHDIVEQHPEGIRPPQLARILGTKVQNLYPHLKQAVIKETIVKNSAGAYYPAQSKNVKSKKKE